ncbi:hypothetical protein HOO65_050281 [Ceratocystis lukuohia]|uniref:HTH CENPB-type domain-containing protein n=1 Tax=Ceratocystis lukuohia TaxID=2019550 RepID=A0ABR4MFV3_9PEZI
MSQFNQEANILLALQALENDASLSVQCAASTYNVCRKKLGHRHKGIPSQCNTLGNARKLLDPEEDSIIRLILDLESRGFSPRLQTIEKIANRLLADRNEPPVGRSWAGNFVRRHPVIQTHVFHKHDSQSAKCDDTAIVSSWFELVEHQITEFGILPSDIYNYGETSFVIGCISSGLVFTTAGRRKKARSVKSRNMEWATAVQAVNSQGWVVSPFIVVAGQDQLARWREDSRFPADWAISATRNGWVDRETSLKWLTHFDQHTKTQKRGRYRLLILDRDEGHYPGDFETYCRENDIITLCTPPNLSHLLQPLNVGCHGLLEKSYSQEIEYLAKCSTTRITKPDFLSAFHAAQKVALSEVVIKEAFREAGLAPWDPEAVISKLDTQPQTLTSMEEEASLPNPLVSATPGDFLGVISQLEHLEKEIGRDQNSFPASILEALKSLANETNAIEHEIALMRSEFEDLRQASETFFEQDRGEREPSQNREDMTVEEESEGTDQVDIDRQIWAELSRR